MRHSAVFRAVIEEAIRTGTVVQFRADGGSMYPTIRDGEAITMAAVSTDEISRGDVLLSRQGKRLLAHRVVGVATDGIDRYFELRGDSKAASDTPIGAEAVVGRIIGVRRNGRLIPLHGRAARLRHSARAAGSRAKWSLLRATAVLFGVSSRPSS